MTLEEIKQFLRVDYYDDDDMLSEMILVSEAYIDKMVGTNYKSDEKAIKLAELLQKKLVYEMYRNRSMGAIDKIQDPIVTSILDTLSIVESDDDGTV